MKKPLVFLCAIILMCAAPGVAGAAPFTDIHDPPDTILDKDNDILVYDHNVAMEVLSAQITINLYDDEAADNKEEAKISFQKDGTTDFYKIGNNINDIDGKTTSSPSTFVYTLSGDDISNYLSDGILTVQVQSVNKKDFYFADSTLTGTMVPITSTAWLLGCGVLSLLVFRRKFSE